MWFPEAMASTVINKIAEAKKIFTDRGDNKEDGEDDNTKPILPAGLTKSIDGRVKVIQVMEVKEGKLTEAIEDTKAVLKVYQAIDGFSSNWEILYDADEAKKL